MVRCAGLLLLAALFLMAWWRPEYFDSPSTASVPHDAAESSAPLDQDDESTQLSTPMSGGKWQEMSGGALRSPGGLVYARGSAQGHRVAHVMMHANDQPDRPGQHGVFADGREAAVLQLIDTAYRQALRHESTDRRVDRQRTILTVDLGRPVGYIGGQVGNRRGRPAARHVRIVLEDDRVITAYPVIP